MRRAILLSALAAAMLLLVGGVALAANTIQCPTESDGINCYGTTGNDEMLGTPQKDGIYGRAGNDILRGEGSGDGLHGEDGNDTIYGGPGADGISDGRGADVAYGGWGNDTFTNGSFIVRGNDVLRGGSGNDTFDGENANDMYGGTGDDYIRGDGNNVMVGGAGQDIFISFADSGETTHIYAVDGEKDQIHCSPDGEEIVEADAIDTFAPLGRDTRQDCDTVNIH